MFERQQGEPISEPHCACYVCTSQSARLGVVYDAEGGILEQTLVKVPREQVVPMLSNGSRRTLMSYTDHSMQRRLKSNAPVVTQPT